MTRVHMVKLPTDEIAFDNISIAISLLLLLFHCRCQLKHSMLPDLVSAALPQAVICVY